jgi:hypothetical protein
VSAQEEHRRDDEKRARSQPAGQGSDPNRPPHADERPAHADERRKGDERTEPTYEDGTAQEAPAEGR